MHCILNAGLLALPLALAFGSVAPARSEQKDQVLDRDFLVQTMTSNHAEIKASEIVQSKTANPKVKDFAQKVVKEHTQLGDKLSVMAKDQKLAVLTGNEKSTKELLDRLNSLQGNDLDREYMKAMVKEHQRDVQLFESQAKFGADANLKNFANECLPHLREHFKEAQQIATEIGVK